MTYDHNQSVADSYSPDKYLPEDDEMICPNCGGQRIIDPDALNDYWECADCETLIDVDGEYAYF